MLSWDHLEIEGKSITPLVKEYLTKVLFKTLNFLELQNINSSDVRFLGNEDIFVFNGANILIFSFSKFKHTIRPVYGQIPLSEAIHDLSEMTNVEPEYLRNKDLDKFLVNELNFTSPISISLPNAYISLKDKEQEDSIEKVAKLLVELIKEDLDKKKKIVRMNPIFNGRDYLLESNLCFVLMEYKPPYIDIYDTLIKPTVESEGFRCLKANDIYSTEPVIEDIWANINKASLIIADITSNNPNVLYELGICHTIGKHVMMITQKPEDIPFNFRHMRCYPYKNDIPGSEELKRNIKSLIGYLKAT